MAFEVSEKSGWAAGSRAFIRTLTVMASITMALFLSSCNEPEGPVEPSAGGDTAATIADLSDNPERYIGRTVVVSGEVNNVYGHRAFTIGGDEFLGGNEILVLNASPVSSSSGYPTAEGIYTNDVVQVRGVVRYFRREDFQAQLDKDIQEDWVALWENKPAVVATSSVVTPRVRPGTSGYTPVG